MKIERENYTLYLGDCLEIMPELGQVDAVITDPPYGVGYEYGVYDDTKENLIAMIPEFVQCVRQLSRGAVAIFTGVKNTEYYKDADWRLCWASPAGTGMSSWGFTCWTPIAVYGKDPYLANGKGSRPDLFVDYKAKRPDTKHSCAKPLSPVTWLLERVNLNLSGSDTILDPFMGSGTTGVACAQLGRKFIGIEIDPDYFEIARKRIETAYAQKVMF